MTLSITSKMIRHGMAFGHSRRSSHMKAHSARDIPDTRDHPTTFTSSGAQARNHGSPSRTSLNLTRSPLLSMLDRITSSTLLVGTANGSNRMLRPRSVFCALQNKQSCTHGEPSLSTCTASKFPNLINKPCNLTRKTVTASGMPALYSNWHRLLNTTRSKTRDPIGYHPNPFRRFRCISSMPSSMMDDTRHALWLEATSRKHLSTPSTVVLFHCAVSACYVSLPNSMDVKHGPPTLATPTLNPTLRRRFTSSPARNLAPSKATSLSLSRPYTVSSPAVYIGMNVLLTFFAPWVSSLPRQNLTFGCDPKATTTNT